MKKKYKSIFFDIDNTLYASSLQVERARRNAVKAMVEAGLDSTEDSAFLELSRIVKKQGSNSLRHYNELVIKINLKEDFGIIAAGVAAYHNTKLAYLHPYPDTIPTLMKLREKGYLLGVITDGKRIKQWEKLIRLGLQHFFHSVTVSEAVGVEKPNVKIFSEALVSLDSKPDESMMVGDRLDKDIIGANIIGMTSVKLLKGRHKNEVPKSKDEEPDYLISRLKEVIDILEGENEEEKR